MNTAFTGIFTNWASLTIFIKSLDQNFKALVLAFYSCFKLPQQLHEIWIQCFIFSMTEKFIKEVNLAWNIERRYEFEFLSKRLNHLFKVLSNWPP